MKLNVHSALYWFDQYRVPVPHEYTTRKTVDNARTENVYAASGPLANGNCHHHHGRCNGSNCNQWRVSVYGRAYNITLLYLHKWYKVQSFVFESKTIYDWAKSQLVRCVFRYEATWIHRTPLRSIYYTSCMCWHDRLSSYYADKLEIIIHNDTRLTRINHSIVFTRTRARVEHIGISRKISLNLKLAVD